MGPAALRGRPASGPELAVAGRRSRQPRPRPGPEPHRVHHHRPRPRAGPVDLVRPRGHAQLAHGPIGVADLNGRYVGLGPANGKPGGPGYRVEEAVAPSASPVAFGPSLLFAPLTDGTALLLTPEQLRGKAPASAPTPS